MTETTAKTTPPARVSLQEFDEIYESVKNWGRWGPDDELGTLNFITPETVRAAAALAVRDGSRAVTVEQQVQRLVREALFLLVFGSRPGIKSALLRRLGASA